MYKIGVFPGKFTPPHRGHINAILQASTKCEKLYVVVSHSEKLESELYKNTKVNPISLINKIRWLSIELSDFDHIKIVALDEDKSGIDAYPNGWELWSKTLKEVVKEPFDVIFGGETQYKDVGYTKYFPEVKYEMYDCERSKYPISATKIRENPYKYWDYIIGAARPYFTKRVLIVGTESCGKSTLTKMLAKIFVTSWAHEEGRFYSTKYLGGNESTFDEDDFFKICWEQRLLEDQALRNSNKIVFFDTDAVITQYYCEMYLGKQNPNIESMIDPKRYDIVLMLLPDVKWVADGFRWNQEQETRNNLHNKLKQMYIDRGFKDKIIEISGNYNERLNTAIAISNMLIK